MSADNLRDLATADEPGARTLAQGTNAAADQTFRSRAVGRGIKRLVAAREFGPAVALLVLVVIIGSFNPLFFSPDVIIANLRAASIVAIVAYGMVLLLTMDEFDLSSGGIYGVCFYVGAIGMATMDPFIAALLAILVGVALGALNGILAAGFRTPVIIVTLGTYSLYGGLVHVISGGQVTGLLPTSSAFFELGGNIFGLPVIAWFAIVIGAILTFLLYKTRFGTLVRASGSNREAAEFSGIPVARIRLYVLMILGGLAGLSGVLSLAYFEGGDPTIGSTLVFSVIAAAIIGGGSGSVIGALIGALIVTVINSGLVFFNVDPLWSGFVTGAVIVVAVGSDALLRRRRSIRQS